MATIITKLELEVSGGQRQLALEYANNPARGLPPWLPGFSSEKTFWRGLADTATRPADGADGKAWEAVVDEVRALSARLGSGTAVLGKLRGAQTGETLFVVTGQQPGALGGPLLAIYKVVTAAALAARIETMLGRPCVPLYWCGGDDTDFQEIRGFNGLSNDLLPFGSSITHTAHNAGMPVGDIDLEWPRQVWDGIQGFVDAFRYGDSVQRIVAEALKRARDHGELTSAILVGLTGGRLALVDGRSAAVRRHASAVIAGYVEDEVDIKREIGDQGRHLDAAGYHAQLAVGADSGVFLLESGIRKNVTPDLHARLLDAVHRSIESCSPGVALRNLVQDHVFKPAAVILGPAEIAYRAQIGTLYDRFNIRRPASIPRLTATYLPPALASLLDENDGSGADTLLSDPPAFARSVYDKSIPESLAEAARELNIRVGDAIEEFMRSVEDGAPPELFGRVRAKLGELKIKTARAAGAVGDIGKAAAVKRWPFLPELEAIVRPAGKPQERSLSVLVPFLFAGPAATDDLLEIARVYTDDLLDGRASHVVYSSK